MLVLGAGRFVAMDGPMWVIQVLCRLIISRGSAKEKRAHPEAMKLLDD
jgi:hypothetical protein